MAEMTASLSLLGSVGVKCLFSGIPVQTRGPHFGVCIERFCDFQGFVGSLCTSPMLGMGFADASGTADRTEFGTHSGANPSELFIQVRAAK